MRFAIIGCGVIGQVHAAALAALAPDAEIAMAVDGHVERARALAEAHGAGAATSPADALARPDIDAVAVCTPSGTHGHLAVVAMRSGKHVLVEKPLDVTVDAARRVAAAERATGCTATVISQHRFDPAARKVREAVEQGRLGRLTSGVASIAWWREQDYYDSGDWRGTWSLDGGGALMNQGIHTVDLLIWMLGEPIEVFAWTERLAHDRVEVEDTAVASIRFASGALGTVHATTAAYPGLTARLQVHGSGGSAVLDGDQLAFLHPQPDSPPAADSGEPSATAVADLSALDTMAHIAQYRDFMCAAREGRTPLVTVADGIRSVATISAIYRSARAGRPVPIEPPVAQAEPA